MLLNVIVFLIMHSLAGFFAFISVGSLVVLVFHRRLGIDMSSGWLETVAATIGAGMASLGCLSLYWEF